MTYSSVVRDTIEAADRQCVAAAAVETVVTAAAVAAAAGQCGVIGGVIGGGRRHSVGMRYEQDHQYVVGLLQQACAAEGICAPYMRRVEVVDAGPEARPYGESNPADLRCYRRP